MKAFALIVVALTLAGCGSDEPASEPRPPSAGAPAPGGGLSVAEAIGGDADGPLLVRGYLIERDGELRLCEAILESYPPQCGEPSLLVEGEVERPARDEQVSVLGDVEDGVIRVTDTAQP